MVLYGLLKFNCIIINILTFKYYLEYMVLYGLLKFKRIIINITNIVVIIIINIVEYR